jgi:hypothetical protein
MTFHGRLQAGRFVSASVNLRRRNIRRRTAFGTFVAKNAQNDPGADQFVASPAKKALTRLDEC